MILIDLSLVCSVEHRRSGKTVKVPGTWKKKRKKNEIFFEAINAMVISFINTKTSCMSKVYKSHVFIILLTLTHVKLTIYKGSIQSLCPFITIILFITLKIKHYFGHSLSFVSVCKKRVVLKAPMGKRGLFS